MRFNLKPINGLENNAGYQMTSEESVEYLKTKNIYVENMHNVEQYLTNQTEHAIFLSVVFPLDILSGIEATIDNKKNNDNK